MAARKSSTSTALKPWEAEMAEAAAAQAATEQVTGGFKPISTRGGILSIDDNAVPDNELRVVIIASLHENQFYEGDYDPSTPQTPVCYSFSETDEGMTPHEASPNPQDEGNGCESCWANQWASADKGKGKACKNVRRLAVITEDALESAEALSEAEIRMMKLPVMSVKNWSSYIKNTLGEEIKRPSYGVVTTIKLVPDAKSQFKVQFHFEELVNFDQELYDAMQRKVAEAKSNMGNAYPVFEEEEKPAPRGRGKAQPMVPQGRAKAAMAKSAAPSGPASRGKGKY